jgi:hypothetical protein
MPRRPAKRAHDLVDLTGDDESETRQKRPAPSGHQNQHHHYPGQGGTSVYGTSSSQTVPSSTAEPDYLDLTQDDDGPPLELYGTLGTTSSSHFIHITNMNRWEDCWCEVLQRICFSGWYVFMLQVTRQTLTSLQKTFFADENPTTRFVLLQVVSFSVSPATWPEIDL